MSQIKVQGNASGTGIFTIASPNSNTDRTLTLPDQTGTVLTNAGPFTASASASNGAVTVNASNNVGMGTSSPNSRLELSGTDTGNGAHLRLTNTTASTGKTYQFSSANSGDLFLSIPGVVDRMVIDSSGNLMVGTLTVRGGITSGTNAWRFGGEASDTGPGAFRHVAAGTSRIEIYGNGNVVNSNNSYGALSDLKLKENITDATPKLEKLNQVRVVNYNLIGQEKKQIGVIAQELEQIFPGMVEERPDLDDDGNDLGTTTKSVKYSVFVPMLIKAIQEQQALINDLTARIAALEAK